MTGPATPLLRHTIGARLGLVFGADDRDRVDCVVGLSVAATVEAITNRLV
jgi:hypothetical protein